MGAVPGAGGAAAGESVREGASADGGRGGGAG